MQKDGFNELIPKIKSSDLIVFASPLLFWTLSSKIKAFVEYYGKQVEEKDIIARVKKAWTRSGKKVGDIKEMDLYIKPEENAVYYVINGTETGAVEFE